MDHKSYKYKKENINYDPTIITNKFRVHNAEQFKESFGEVADTYYLGINRPQAFVDNQAFNDGTDTNPPTPNDDIGSEFYNYDDMLSAKKVASTDVTIAIPRRNWTTGHSIRLLQTRLRKHQHNWIYCDNFR